ncbi:MAG TPA: hypothetical protein VF898_13100, partial [Chloroflexota bacterium]
MRFRHFVLAALLAGVTLLAIAPVSGSGSSWAQSETHRSPAMLRLATWHSSGPAKSRFFTSAQQNRPSQQAVSGTIQSSAQMKLSPSAFPVDFGEKGSSAMTAADADNSPMSNIHSISYQNLGMLGGWLQYYSKPFDTGYADNIYLGSYYRDPQAAQSAFNDVGSSLILFGTTGVCSFGDQCLEVKVTVTWPDGQYQGLFRVVQKSNALGEFLVDVPQASYPTLQDQVRGYLDGTVNGFLGIFAPARPTSTPLPIATPTNTATLIPTSTPVPTATATATSVPVDFSIISARVEKNKAKPDLNLLTPALKQGKVGTKVYLSIYLVIRSAPAGATITFQYDVRAGAKSVF